MSYGTDDICRCPAPRPGHEAVKRVEGCRVGKIIASSAWFGEPVW